MKMTLLVISEILGLFVSTLNADDKYSLRNSNNLPQPIQMQLSNQKKKFPQAFCSISEIYIKVFNIFK